MAHSPIRHQQRRERQRRKRARKAARRQRHAIPTSRTLEYMRLAGRQPLRDCLVSPDRPGLGPRDPVVIARNGSDGIDVALFLLDRGCRGIGDARSFGRLTEQDYADLLKEIRPFDTLSPLSLDAAAKLIEAAVAYGKGWGFDPPPGFRAARQMLRGANPQSCELTFRFGWHDGRPLFRPERHEDPEPVLQKLIARLGPEGFVYSPSVRWTAPEVTSEIEPSPNPGELRFDGEELLAGSEWRHLRVIQARLLHWVLDFGLESVHEELRSYASDEFNPALDHEINLIDPRYHSWFLPWLAHTWQPCDILGEAYEEGPDRRKWPRRCLGLEFLAAHRKKLEAQERRFLETVCARPYRFYQVVEVEKGRGLLLQDLLSDERVRVNEFAGTHFLQPESIVYARVVRLDNHAIVESFAPFEIPPSFGASLRDHAPGIRARQAAAAGPSLDPGYELHDLALRVMDRLEFLRELSDDPGRRGPVDDLID